MQHPVFGIDAKHDGRGTDLTAGDIVELAARADDAGFESFWTNEDIGYDALALLAAASRSTRRIRLGTAVVNVYARSAMQIAMGIATADELSGGRAILGLSVGHSPWNDRGHGIPIERPISRVREYVHFIRAALTGRPFRHDGTIFTGVDTRLNFDPARSSVPIHVAGERPQIIAAAGEVGDGLIVNLVPASYIAGFVVGHLRSTAEAAGRNADALELTALVTTCVDAQSDIALAQARATFVHRLRRSLKMLETHPSEHHAEIRHLHGLMLAGERDRAAADASPELVGTIVAFGTPEMVRDRLFEFVAAGCSRVIAVAYPRGRANVERLMSSLAPLLPLPADAESQYASYPS